MVAGGRQVGALAGEAGREVGPEHSQMERAVVAAMAVLL